MEQTWTNFYEIENEREYILNINDLSTLPTTNAIMLGETIQEVLIKLEKLKQKNIAFYERLYKEHHFEQYLEKKRYYQNMKFKIFKGYELKRFMRM